MTIENFWMLYADELWEMGYRKCAPEPVSTEPPIPMTIIKNGREEDRPLPEPYVAPPIDPKAPVKPLHERGR